jgi:AraC-like DNA-binding protein
MPHDISAIMQVHNSKPEHAKGWRHAMNIRYVPPPPLNAYIDAYYYCDAPVLYPREQILPAPWLALLINFGGPFIAYEVGQTTPFAVCTDSWWVGMRANSHIVQWTAPIRFILVDFKPGGAASFVRLPLDELHQRVVPSEALWGSFAREIRERLAATAPVSAQFALLDHLLLTRLTTAPHGWAVVQQAINQIFRAQGSISIHALSAELGLSHKHLISQFKQVVGGTPKELARIIRFDHILLKTNTVHPVDWTDIAYQFGYTDQAHFTNDFASFTGHPPTSFWRLRRQVFAEHPTHATLRQLPVECVVSKAGDLPFQDGRSG